MWIHIITPIILSIIIWIITTKLGWTKHKNKYSKYLPPGYIIGIVWIIILGMLGYVHYLVYPSNIANYIVFVIAYCLAYPFIAMLYDVADVLNILAFTLSVITIYVIYKYKRIGVWYTIPFLIWTLYVSVVTLIIYI